MVKGVQKHVIVLNMEREKLFEQAIFIVRPEAAGEYGVSEQEVLWEAKRVAEDFTRKNLEQKSRKRWSLPAPAVAVAGAAASSLAWLALRLIGV